MIFIIMLTLDVGSGMLGHGPQREGDKGVFPLDCNRFDVAIS